MKIDLKCTGMQGGTNEDAIIHFGQPDSLCGNIGQPPKSHMSVVVPNSESASFRLGQEVSVTIEAKSTT